MLIKGVIAINSVHSSAIVVEWLKVFVYCTKKQNSTKIVKEI